MKIRVGGLTLALVAVLAASAVTAQAPVSPVPPTASLAQLMRAILFPNSNIIFNVQSQDPAAPKPIYEQGSGGFSWVDWGAGIYTGWEVVENAAFALEEVTDLVMKPGRVCTNGRPVPLEQADFVAGIGRLRAVARDVQAAARAEDQEQVIELTTRLAEACYRCHQVHRIAPPGGENRCVP
jgi:hypothetical protein